MLDTKHLNKAFMRDIILSPFNAEYYGTFVFIILQILTEICFIKPSFGNLLKHTRAFSNIT